MKDLKDLADKSLALLDHEAYRSEIQQIFQRVKEAITSFVRTIMFIYGYAYSNSSFPV